MPDDPADHGPEPRLSGAIIAVLIPVAAAGVLGLGAVVAIHELAEIVVIGNGLRARRGINPRPKVEQPGATVDRSLGVLTRA